MIYVDWEGPRTSETFRVGFRTDTEDRLAGTCFRGTDQVLAGNFCRWNDGGEFLRDPAVIERLGAWLESAASDPRVELLSNFSMRTCLEFPWTVGWASTVPRDRIGPDAERRSLNGRDRIIADFAPWNGPYKAPATNLVTLDCRFRMRPRLGCWEAQIGTAYPGPDIGRLVPAGHPRNAEYDISRARRIAFFDWNHPGEPVALS